MNETPRRWLAAALLAAACYAAFGIAASAIGAAPVTARISLVARWGAFLLSGAAFLVHIAHEVRRGCSARQAAWHVAVGAALGGFGLALSANLHELVAATGFRPRMLVALAAWPLLTGVPAYVGAFLLAAVLRRERDSGDAAKPRS